MTDPAPIRIAIHGAAGRMGQRLVALAAEDPGLRVTAALEAARHPQLGTDAGLVAGTGQLGVKLSSSLEQPVDVVVDFSTPEGTSAITTTCLERKLPLVIATTGLDPVLLERIAAGSATIPILRAASMSLAVNLAMKLAWVAATALKEDESGADVEIIERHHRFKEDSPSGTALRFGEIITGVMGQKDQRHGRHGRPGARPHWEIGYHAVRTGDNPGEHTILFGLLGESLEITVRATGRDCYARGALAAAKFLAGKEPGLYGMNDVLRL